MSVQGETKEKTRLDIREPGRYRVVMHNVVEILMEIFHKGRLEAVHLMMTVHESGQAAVGTYSYDMAATKVRIASARAKEGDFPFRMTIEEA